MDFIESTNILEKQTLIIDMASEYVTVFYTGTIDHEKQFIWNTLEVTEGGGALTSFLLTLDEVTERLNDLTLGKIDKYPAIIEWLKYK